MGFSVLAKAFHSEFLGQNTRHTKAGQYLPSQEIRYFYPKQFLPAGFDGIKGYQDVQ